MMRTYHILAAFFALLLFVAGDAFAINETRWPSTLMDSDCTDSYDTPTAQSGGSVRPAARTSGSGDGYCDHDSRIFTGAITSPTTFQPIRLPPGHMGMEIWVDADAVSNDTDTWSIKILVDKPHDDAALVVQAFAEQATEGNKAFVIYPHAAIVWDGDDDALDGPLPRTFSVQLFLNTATSFTGDISWVSF